MLKKHVFSYIRKWCMVGGLCLAFPWVAYAQQQKISLNIQNVTLKQAMEQIKEQAVVNVAYSKEFVDPNKTVSLKVENVSLQTALTQLFKGTDVGFRFLDNSVLLYNQKEQDSSGAASKEQQIVSVKGTVVDQVTGEPIIGASVAVEGSSKGTSTDLDGKYSLNAPVGSTLKFSYVGYKETKKEVLQAGVLDVSLMESSVSLDDVVVVGYGVQKKVNVTGAVSMVKGDELENRPVANVSAGLQGLLPGVSITSSSGQPGAVPSITVRGVSTINSSTAPLILIDGVSGGDLNLLNPNDVESVSVLKDAASAAVYAPQKGASPDEVDFLEKGMIHYAQVIKETRQMDISEIPGAGAAGGLGGGVLPFLNAELQSGIDIVLDMLRFRETIQGADLIFTGEGKLDKQTGMGKALGGILRYAKEEAVPVIAIGGCVEACEILNEMGFASIFSIQTAPVSLQEAMDRDFALKNIRQVVTQIMRTIQIGTHG